MGYFLLVFFKLLGVGGWKRSWVGYNRYENFRDVDKIICKEILGMNGFEVFIVCLKFLNI